MHPSITNLDVNGITRQLSVAPDTPLLTVLREDLDLKGARFGCGQERCGACTVLVDGRPQHSCKTPVSAVDQHAVTTIEGLSAQGLPGPVQRIFLEEQAAQCGYCINGIIISLTSLLRRRPLPSHDEIIHFLDERHLCRCGAQPRILRAALRALAEAAETDGQQA